MINIPSKATLYSRILTALQTTFGITIPAWGQNFLRALALVFSGEFKLFYLGLGSLEKNMFIDQSDAEMTLRYGYVKLGRYPFPATQGVYDVTVTGSVGATIPGQTTFISNDSSQNPGKLYILDSAYTLVSSPDTITLRALTAGVGARLTIGDTLTSTAPIINVNALAAVSSEDNIPNDAETLEQYRAKGLASYRLLPSGDNAISYREEGSLNVSGVQQIYPYAYSGHANEINLFIEAIAADSTDGKGTPTSTIIDDVTAAVETNRPLGVFLVHYLPIVLVRVDVNINMTGYAVFTADQQALILASITQELFNTRPFVAAADTIASRKDRIGNFVLGPAIAGAVPGLPFGAVTFKINTVTQTDYTLGQGEIPWLNAVTYA